MTLPVWTMRPFAKLSSGLSTLLNCCYPLFDPTDYLLDTIIYDIDFSSAKMCRLIEAVGEKVLHTPDGKF